MSCWEHLGLEPTEDQTLIRNAYRALLPGVHPERDPEGFQALRSAYEEALRQAREGVSAVSTLAAPPSASEAAVQAFVDLLQDAQRRFQPDAWHDYCRLLDRLPLEELDGVDTRLRGLLLSNGPLGHACVSILSERMAWAKRLMQLPFEEAEALDHFLQRIAEADPFDLTSLSAWPAHAQVETLWYTRTLNHLFDNRPLPELRGWCALHLCLPMPADPAYYPGLYRQCTLAGVALGEALAYYQARQAEAPDDLDNLYLLALQMQQHELDALDLWCRLWRELHLPEAAAWLLAWSAQHAPERLPLLILACDRSQQELGSQYALDDYRQGYAEPAQSPQTLARWQRAASTELPALARTFVAWQLGDSEWPFLAELLDAPETPLTLLYRQAWLLQRGDGADLEPLLCLPVGEHPLDAILAQGFAHHARQHLQWLRESATAKVLQQKLATPGSALPSTLQENTAARAQMLSWLRRLRHPAPETLQRLHHLLAPLPSWSLPATLKLQLGLQQTGRYLPPLPTEAGARWQLQRQTLWLAGLLEQPQRWLERLTERGSRLPTTTDHPADAVQTLWLDAHAHPRQWLDGLDERDPLQGLIAAELVSLEFILGSRRLPSVERIEACAQRHADELAGDPLGQMIVDALLYHDPDLRRELRELALQRLQGFTCPGLWFDAFREGLVKGQPEALAQSICKDNGLLFSTMQALFEAMRDVCQPSKPRVPASGLLRSLQQAKDSAVTPPAVRLAITLLLSRCERMMPRHAPNDWRAQWRFWQLGKRLNRLNFTVQTLALLGAGLPLSLLADKLSGDLALAVLGVTLLGLITCLLRRLHDMNRGVGTLLMLLTGSFFMPYISVVLFFWPGDPLPNRYGPPSGSRVQAEQGLQARLRQLNGFSGPTS
ncbi:DUF805 domain-containing protein [Pseudomonas sp. GOM7]|uniref:DUF805 domain-containing protein n=1 Tax=Pseudomonas sp. GOM7 TaxID=2998079 RepID=UPI00227A4511|nr:DUF805 domain-containing protein [Pseudomonas sp. GOM7]WAJ37549.1 DUF805 domain-containing protein [Pseudomonas sp. GOM7]